MGTAAQEDHRFSLIAAPTYDPAPQDLSREPYGFRYISGTLPSRDETRSFTDPFGLHDTIACGEDGLTASARAPIDSARRPIRTAPPARPGSAAPARQSPMVRRTDETTRETA